MLDLFHIAKPQNCDIQIFYGSGTSIADSHKTWNKPRGVSNVYMLLIGSGGNGNSSTGGGSGSVTVWFGAAQNVPDQLRVITAGGGAQTQINYLNAAGGNGTALLVAGGGSGGTAGSAVAAGVFAASGFYQSIAGQAGTSGAPTASSTTFLGGGGSVGSLTTGNYGYTQDAGSGYFQMQPIIVGLGGNGVNKGGVGCGGGISTGLGGQSMVLIASW